MANTYSVIIRASLDNRGVKSGSKEIPAAFAQMNQAIMREEKQLSAQMIRESRAVQAVQQRAIKQREQEEKQLAATMIRESRAVQAVKERAAQTETRAAQQSAREVQRINAQTARQAEQQAKLQERVVQDLEREKVQLIRREHDAFLRAEAEKTASARAAAASQVSVAESAKGAMIAAWGAIKVAALAAFAAVAAGVVGLGMAISRAASMERLELGLAAVAGSTQKAREQLERLKEVAKLPGLGYREAIMASMAFQALKIEAKDAERIIMAFGKGVAFTGGKEDLEAVLLQVRQMLSTEKLVMADVKPILQRAPILARAFQDAFGTIDLEKVRGLNISNLEILNKWVAALEKLPDAPNAAANSFENFADIWDRFLVAVGRPFLAPVKTAIDALSPLLANFGTELGRVFQVIVDDGEKLWTDLPASTKAAFQDMVDSAVSGGGQIIGWFRENYPVIRATVVATLNAIAGFWKEHGEVIKETIGALLTAWGAILKVGMQAISGNWKAFWSNLPAAIDASQVGIVNAAKALLEILWSEIWKHRARIQAAGFALGQSVAEGVLQGIKSSDTVTKVKVWAIELASSARNALQIKSPSQVFFRIGTEIAAGLQLGIASGGPSIQQTLADMLDIAGGKFTKAPKKPIESADKRIAKAVREAADAMRELAGKDTAIDRLNHLLSDPLVKRRIDERTISLLQQAAALEDAAGKTRERRVGFDWSKVTRERTVGLDFSKQVRERQVSGGMSETDLAIAQRYGSVIDDLNGKLGKHSSLTQVQITLEQLEKAGLGDLTDARAQEALAIAQTIDQQNALEVSRHRIADWAGQVADIFGRAVDQWDGTFKGFFRSIKEGFFDMFKRGISDLLQSTIFKGAQGILGRILGGGGSTGGGGGGILSSIGGIFGGGAQGQTGGFAGGGGILSSLLGGGGGAGISVPGSSSAFGAVGGGGLLMGAGGMSGSAGGAASGGAAAAGSLAPFLLPLLGAGLGTSLGGSSRTGQVLGGLGGAALGVFGLSALAAFGLGGSTLAGIAPFLAIAGPISLIAAPLLIAGAIILAKNAQRRKEEKIRNQASLDTLPAVYEILWAAQRGELTVGQAKTQWEQVHQQYLTKIAGVKDSKTRRNALLWWDRDVTAIWPQIEAAAKAGETAKSARAAFSPTFAHGGFSAESQLIRVTPGEGYRWPGSSEVNVIPGQYQGREDTQYMFAAKGTQIVPRSQMPAEGFQSGGTVGNGNAPVRSRDVVIKADSSRLASILSLLLDGLKTEEGGKIIVQQMNKDARTNGTDGFAGQLLRTISR